MPEVPLPLRLMMTVHIACGALALIAFWIAVAVRKGGRAHLVAGRAFEWTMYVVIATSFVAAAFDMTSMQTLHPERPPEWAPATARFGAFLGYLALVSLATVRRGVRSVQTRRDPSHLRTPAYLALAAITIVAGVAIAGVALSGPRVDVRFLVLAPLGPAIGAAMFHQAFRRAHGPRDWMYHHLGSMLGGGIAAHTAFAVFGMNRVLDLHLPGAWQALPWALPSLIGVPAIFLWVARLRRSEGGAARRIDATPGRPAP